ncbi:hypothetical protein ED733_006824 [Metarhizium rileyi]|uniref:Cell wall glucanase n=1 Tax=Metarhizium rileyi (strain RCEF 4871) TaxID=1649241 RepID=A0A5C6GMS5_METRR|nr:hypothetical protein ED733_006824 [Metarhizium rileyi]
MNKLQSKTTFPNNHHEQGGEGCMIKSHSPLPMLGDFHKLYRAKRSAVIDQPESIASSFLVSTEAQAFKVVNSNDSAQQSCTSAEAKLGDFQKLRLRLHGQYPILDKSPFRTIQQLSVAEFTEGPMNGLFHGNTQQSNSGEKRDTTTTAQKHQKGPSSPFSLKRYPHLQGTRGTPVHRFIHGPKATNNFLSGDSAIEPELKRIANTQLGLLQTTCYDRRDLKHGSSFTSGDGKNRNPISSTAKSSEEAANIARILSYKVDKEGPVTPIISTKFTLDQQHELLSLKLVPLQAADTTSALQNEQVARNGVHIFLDMSNINISFQSALKGRFAIEEHARFVPLPYLNLQFLTEILVRGRKIMALNAGCSVLPHRQEPRFVQELRDLGYRVDLRERKRADENWRRVDEDLKIGEASSSDELACLRRAGRYVEELVDETLQIRIAESVMEFFKDQGTLVIATGDAQPAKYSDGFFVYAERALRMGWNVEVVSWRTSLSSHWNRPDWVGQWRGRFRVIELDDYIDHLLM